MSERFYRQQMEHFNITSVYELGLLHEGKLKKAGKRQTTKLPDGTVKAVLKADVVIIINNYFYEEVTGLDKLTMKSLNDLSAALCYSKETQGFKETDLSFEAFGRIKKPYIETIISWLALPETYTLDLTKLTVKTLKQLIIQLDEGLIE